MPPASILFNRTAQFNRSGGWSFFACRFSVGFDRHSCDQRPQGGVYGFRRGEHFRDIRIKNDDERVLFETPGETIGFGAAVIKVVFGPHLFDGFARSFRR